MPNPIISYLELVNFKCHKDIKMNLSPLTILTGGNATGKSSVIQAILMLSKARKDKSTLATDDVYGVNLGLPSSIINANPSVAGVLISAAVNDAKAGISLTLKDAREESLSFDVLDYLGDADMTVLYLNAERIGPRISSRIYESLGYYVGSRGENTYYVLDKLDRMQVGNHLPFSMRATKSKRFLANCEEWMSKIIPGINIKASTNSELNIATVRISSNNDDFYVPAATGFGISYVLPIVVQALAAFSISNPVLIIENPEAHLHPYSQSMLAKFLANVAMNGVQVIIETHSEHIVNGCRLELAKRSHAELMKILFFSADSEYTSIDISSVGELEHWPQGFFDQTKSDLRELLEIKRCGK